MEKKLPRWNTEEIYKGVEETDFLNDLEKLSSLIKTLEEITDKEDTKVYEVLKKMEEGDTLLTNLSQYVSALLSTNTAEEKYIKALSKVEDLDASFSGTKEKAISYIYKKRNEIGDKEREEFGVALNDFLTKAQHQMTLEEERLSSEFLTVSSSAWSRLQDSVTSSIEESGETLISLRGKATNKNREIRKDAFYREIKILKEHEASLAAALNGVKGTALLLEKRRGWDSPLEKSIFTSRISNKTLNALIEALEDSREMFGEYFKIKAKLLGLEKLDFYDLFAPVGKAEKTYSFEEAEKLIVSSYSSFDKEAGDFVKKVFSNNWIDAEMRKGKVGGAYDTYFPLSKQSRIFCNYDYSYDAVATIAHEAGHAFHDYIVSSFNTYRAEYPATLAETASIFGENLLFQNIIKTVDKDEELMITELYVQSASQVCIDILSRFYFEKEFFEKRKEGELTASEICTIMEKAQEKAYGKELGVKHKYMWAVKSHYYSEAFSFYNYPYAFGLLFALSLFSLKDKTEDLPSLYKNLLKKTGFMNSESVAKEAGLDIENKEFWVQGLNQIRYKIER